MADNKFVRRGSPQILIALKGTPQPFLKEDAEEDRPWLMTQGPGEFLPMPHQVWHGFVPLLPLIPADTVPVLVQPDFPPRGQVNCCHQGAVQ